MATVIDALIVTLGLEGKGFTDGADKARKSLRETSAESDKAAKNMEIRGKQAAMFFSKLRNEALGLLAIFTAGKGVTSFVQSTITGAASLGYMAENLGMATEKMSAYQLANEKMGGSAAGMAAQLRESADAVARAKAGMAPGTGEEWFYRMEGPDVRSLKDGEQYLIERSKIIARLYKTDPAKASMIAQQMGISPDTFDLLKQGPDAINKQIEQSQRLSKFTKEDAKNAQALRGNFIDLSRAFDLTGTKVLLALSPAMEKLIAQFRRLADWILEHKGDITEWVDQAAKSVIEFIEAFQRGDFDAEIKDLKNIASAFVEIAKAIGDAARAWNDWSRESGSLVSWDSTRRELELISKGINKLRGKSSDQIKIPAPTAGQTEESKQLFDGLESKYQLPSGLLDSVWAQESGRGKNMLSSAGAKGHFQFMDPTAKQYGLKDPYDLKESAGAAARYYRDLLDQHGGDLRKALASYNWGPGNVSKKGMDSMPAETRNYITQVTARIREGEKSPADTLPLNTVNVANRATDPSRGRVERTTNNTHEVQIHGPINIVTQATDARGVARDLGAQIGAMLGPQSNTGLR